MKKVLTAIGNANLNNKIRNMENYELLSKDISNDEELLETLEKEEKVDILFLAKSIICHYSVNRFIELIKCIHKNIYIVLFNEEQNCEEVKKYSNLKICSELNIDFKKLEQDFPEENRKENIINMKEYMSKVIAISGANGIGKSTFSTFFAKNVEKENKKILLIDFDLDENYIKTILKLGKKAQYSENVKEMITKVDKNLDALCNLNLFFPYTDNVNFFTIQKMLTEFRHDYDLIVIDTSSSINSEYTKKVFYNSDKIIFLVEPNILEIKKAKKMLEVIETDWNISTEKINIVINKANMYELSQALVQELFPDIKIIGKMKYNDAYNLMLNQNINKKEILKEYDKIYKKIDTD